MKGITLNQAGGSYSLVNNLEVPTPNESQILVKSLVTAFNPVEEFMRQTSLLITHFPIVLGADASGFVISTGSSVRKFKTGDRVFGCTALGTVGYSPFQEFHLMDEHLAFRTPERVSTEEAATVGVGLLTASLGLVIGMKVELELQEVTADRQFAIQIAKLAGYKVLAACSPSNDELVTSIGADATFSYKLSLLEQMAAMEQITGGKYTRIFDASAQAGEAGMKALEQNGSGGKKYFATVNDWTPIVPVVGVEVYMVTLGEIGRSGNAHIEKTNKDIADLIVKLEPSLENGHLKPLEYVRVGDVGVGEILKGLEAFKTHKSGKKLIVRLADE